MVLLDPGKLVAHERLVEVAVLVVLDHLHGRVPPVVPVVALVVVLSAVAHSSDRLLVGPEASRIRRLQAKAPTQGFRILRPRLVV